MFHFLGGPVSTRHVSHQIKSLKLFLVGKHSLMFTPLSMAVKNEGITLGSLGEHLEHPKPCHGNRSLRQAWSMRVVQEFHAQGDREIKFLGRESGATTINLIVSEVVNLNWLNCKLEITVMKRDGCMSKISGMLHYSWLTKDHHLMQKTIYCLGFCIPFLFGRQIPKVLLLLSMPPASLRLGLPVSPLCDRTDFRLGKSQAHSAMSQRCLYPDIKWGDNTAVSVWVVILNAHLHSPKFT